MRRGAATSLMQLGWSFDDVKLYGRWASDSSAREYIRLGQSALARMSRHFSDEQLRLFDVLASGIAVAFEGLAASGHVGQRQA